MHGLNLIIFILYQLIVILTVVHVVMDNRHRLLSLLRGEHPEGETY